MVDRTPFRITGSLVVAVALTAAAGFVDAHVYLHVVHVFVANMSGNVVLLGISLGDGQWAEVGAHLVAIVLFIAGVGLGTLVHDRRRAAGRPLRPDLILLGEAAMLVVVIALRLVEGTPDPATVQALDVPILAVGALAMGLQTVVIGKVGSVAVATTYESGAVARVGEEAALAGREPARDQRSEHLRVVQVLGTVLIAYALGAAVAAAAGASSAWMLLPLAVVVITAAVLRAGRDQSSASTP